MEMICFLANGIRLGNIAFSVVHVQVCFKSFLFIITGTAEQHSDCVCGGEGGGKGGTRHLYVLTHYKRTWGDREGHWRRWLWFVIVTKVLFSFRKSVFRDVSTNYNLDLRFLVKIKKANFNDNGGFVVGTHKHFSWGYKRPLLIVLYKRFLLAGYAKN